MENETINNYKVLLIEDDLAVADLLEAMLAKSRPTSFSVTRAETLAGGREKLALSRPDIVLLDLSLPDSRGFETFEQMRQQALSAPIIILTGTDDEALAIKAMREGAQDYIVKGAMDIKSLVRAIRYAIERQRIEEQLRQAKSELEQRVKDRTQELEKINLDLIREIDERKKTEQDLLVAHASLKETQQQLIQAAKMQVVGGLASGVAHEVKNPLAIILQGVEFLSKKLPKDDQNITLTLEYITNAVERADTIVRGLMDFASISQMNMLAQKLNPVLEKALMLLKHKLDKNHVQVSWQVPENLPDVDIDRNKIEQVFMNLFMNAIDAMPSGGTLLIREYLKPAPAGKGQSLVVEIEDTGTGISEEALKRIFEPFFTTKRARGGTGLGLAIVRNILEMHNAKIDIRSNGESKGTKATVTFSLA